jgi:hypothetical protein
MTEAGDANPLDLALRRLNGAADLLEASIAQSMEKARSSRDRASELSLLSDDRARLAEDLDLANARAQSLAHANRDVSRRLDQAMETIRSVLATVDR